MDRRALVKKTVTLVRKGDLDAFENFYILTVQNTYGKICCLTDDKALQDKLLVGTYIMLHNHAHGLALDEGELENQIDGEISRLATKKFGLKECDLYGEEKYRQLSEEKAAALWMRVESKLGSKEEEEKEEKNSAFSYLYSFLKVVFTGLIMVIMVFVLLKTWNWYQSSRKRQQNEMRLETIEETKTEAADIVIETPTLSPGWEQQPDGSIYYVKKDGHRADGVLKLGKQDFTFSKDGELVMLGDNREVAKNPNVCFDEDIRYEVRDGDIYKIDENSQEPEVCAVRNGHVVMADTREGFLWYICKYQVPNSEQVRTVIYRSDLDGENQEEIYATDNTLEIAGFQMTGKWMYYLSDEMLLRRDLQTGKVELLAEKVKNYFAWEDTAYYMKDRGLESVAQGQDYYGIEAGYRIELQGDLFVLYDVSGELVEPDQDGEKQVGDRIYRLENGTIRSVRPADRTSNGINYYIDQAGSERKIYWKSDTGSQGLIRQEGLTADSMCIAGEWLYYSARTAEYGGEYESQIYRVNMQTMEIEQVGDAFRGYMKNLYYFDSVHKIFGEYVPSVADPDAIHGKIAVIPIGEEMQIISDIQRPDNEGSDFLEMVMADGSRIYCIYHECYFDQASGQFSWESSRAVILEYSGTPASAEEGDNGDEGTD